MKLEKGFSRTCLALAISQALCAAQAATITVNSTLDEVMDDANCTLREAIISANTNPAMSTSGCVAGEAGEDTIDASSIAGDEISLSSALTVSEDLILNGSAANRVRIDGQYNTNILEVDGAKLTINDFMLRNGSSTTYSGGIDIINSGEAIINNVHAIGNTGVNGGAVSVRSGSTATLTGGLFFGGSASNGGAVFVTGPNSKAYVEDSNLYGNGGSAVYASNGSETTISGTVITAGNATRGAGIRVHSASLNLFNSTVSGNESQQPGSGLFIDTNGVVDVKRASFVYNNGFSNGSGAISIAASGSLSIQNSIVTASRASSGAIIDNAGTVLLSRYNLFGDSRFDTATSFTGFTPSPTDIVATSDGTLPTAFRDIVEPLARHTHKLPMGSPAINSGDTSLCTASPLNGVDQRGVPLEGNCDIGAFELTTSTITVNSSSTTSSPTLCNFEDAIVSSRSKTSVGGCASGADANTIVFDITEFPPSANNEIILTGIQNLKYTDVNIVGQGSPALTINANKTGGVFYLYNGSLQLDKVIVTGGSTMGSGGGIFAFRSRVTITNSSIKGNTAGSSGGGIESSNSVLSIDSSTISNNIADFGGGIYRASGPFLIKNSTVSSNTGRLFGGGMSLSRFSGVSILNCTISNNTAQEGGGIEFFNSGSPTISNSIISGNDALIGAEIYANNSLTLTDDQSNIFGDSAHTSIEAFLNFTPGLNSANLTSDAGSPTAIESILLPLSSNGGVGYTHLIPVSSPAVDRGDPTICSDKEILLDQRGVERDARCDTGAVEVIVNESCFVINTSDDKVVTFCL